jgi:hypothetical protein
MSPVLVFDIGLRSISPKLRNIGVKTIGDKERRRAKLSEPRNLNPK